MSDSAVPYRFDRALVRRPSPSVVDGLRDSVGPDPDYERLCVEHERYVEALENAGVSVLRLPALNAFPDSVFVEDPALVFTAGAILLRPGAPSRRGESELLEDTLRSEFDTVLTASEGYADGGDILYTPGRVMIGLSGRTDAPGARAVQRCLERLGLTSSIVQTPRGVLHFKSDCALLDKDTVLSTRRLAASGVFSDFAVLEVPPGEEAAR